jgi:hypothetical protein
MLRTTRSNVILVVTISASVFVAALSGARADPQPAFDRAMVERLVRAQEAQTRALEKLVSVTERCKR